MTLAQRPQQFTKMEEVGEDDGADSRGDVAGNMGGRDCDNLQTNASAQERRSQRDRAEQEENVLQEFENLLVAVKQTPRLWRVSRMGFLREFCSFVLMMKHTQAAREEQMESVIVKWIPSNIRLLFIQQCTA